MNCREESHGMRLPWHSSPEFSDFLDPQEKRLHQRTLALLPSNLIRSFTKPGVNLQVPVFGSGVHFLSNPLCRVRVTWQSVRPFFSKKKKRNISDGHFETTCTIQVSQMNWKKDFTEISIAFKISSSCFLYGNYLWFPSVLSPFNSFD